MASFGHVAVGMAAARVNGARGAGRLALDMVLWSALSLAPDLDVIAFALDIPYADQFGHRGFTHSLAMSLLTGLIVFGGSRLAGQDNRQSLKLGALATGVWASHPLLDAMTDGGLGVALWWPVSDERIFLPWRPIPVSPIGLSFFSKRGLTVFFTEVLIFSPLVVYALWPR